jgi:hypothetical protein
MGSMRRSIMGAPSKLIYARPSERWFWPPLLRVENLLANPAPGASIRPIRRLGMGRRGCRTFEVPS